MQRRDGGCARPAQIALAALHLGGTDGWIATRRHSPKADDLAHNPHVSLAYVADVVHPVYVDGVAQWEDGAAERSHVWELFLAASPPLGYDPGPIYGSVEAPDYGVLRITPRYIELGDVSGAGERHIHLAGGGVGQDRLLERLCGDLHLGIAFIA